MHFANPLSFEIKIVSYSAIMAAYSDLFQIAWALQPYSKAVLHFHVNIEQSECFGAPEIVLTKVRATISVFEQLHRPSIQGFKFKLYFLCVLYLRIGLL